MLLRQIEKNLPLADFVAQLDAEAMRRIGDLDVPIGHAAVNVDLASHALGRARRVAAIDLQQRAKPGRRCANARPSRLRPA